MIKERYRLITELNYGWSDDRKYCVSDARDHRYLLRKSPLFRLEQAKSEFNLVHRLFGRGLSVPEPLTSGLSEDALTYDRLYKWVEGVMLQDVLQTLEQKRQIQLGTDAGRILRSIHSLDICVQAFDWSTHYLEKIERKLAAYEACEVRLDQETLFMQWISDSVSLLRNRPITHQHGDYHPGNMILTPEGQLFVIDFDRHSIGDPFEEFNRIVWSAEISPWFASAQIEAYFDSDIPQDFFRLLKLYLAVNAIGSLPWATKFGEDEIEVMIKQAEMIASWYPDPSQIVPEWFISV